MAIDMTNVKYIDYNGKRVNTISDTNGNVLWTSEQPITTTIQIPLSVVATSNYSDSSSTSSTTRVYIKFNSSYKTQITNYISQNYGTLVGDYNIKSMNLYLTHQTAPWSTTDWSFWLSTSTSGITNVKPSNTPAGVNKGSISQSGSYYRHSMTFYESSLTANTNYYCWIGYGTSTTYDLNRMYVSNTSYDPKIFIRSGGWTQSYIGVEITYYPN